MLQTQFVDFKFKISQKKIFYSNILQEIQNYFLGLFNKIRKLITADTDLSVLRSTAYQEGMQPLLLNGAEKIAAGLTTVEEVLKVAPPIEQ